jgi:gas vesicle protein
MINFLGGLIIGVVLGLFFTAILSAGAAADEKNDNLLRSMKQQSEQTKIVSNS